MSLYSGHAFLIFVWTVDGLALAATQPARVRVPGQANSRFIFKTCMCSYITDDGKQTSIICLVKATSTFVQPSRRRRLAKQIISISFLMYSGKWWYFFILTRTLESGLHKDCLLGELLLLRIHHVNHRAVSPAADKLC